MAGKKKNKTRARSGAPIDQEALNAVLEDPTTGYLAKVQAIRKLIPFWDMADIIAACQMELELLGTDPAKSGTRSAYLRMMIDAQKWTKQQEDGERAIVIHIENAAEKGL